MNKYRKNIKLLIKNKYREANYHDKKFLTDFISYREHFKKRIANDFHPYFWARFAQPTEILYVKNNQVMQILEATFKKATKRMIIESVPMLPKQFTTEMLWETALRLTYGAELRSESKTAPQSIIETSLPELETLTKSVASECSLKNVTDAWLNDTNRIKYFKKAGHHPVFPTILKQSKKISARKRHSS